MSNQPVGYNSFLRILSRRFKGKYTSEQLESVLNAYTGERGGIRGKLNGRNEFKDEYFGAYRFSEKGFDNFKTMIAEGLLQKLKLAKMARAFAIRKKWHEKRNKTVWMVRNMIEGYKYQNNLKLEFMKSKSKVKASQILFHYKKRKVQLENEKRIK